MDPLNFPKFNFRVKNTENQLRIFDIVRKKFVVLQPEEWVRQHVIHYLNFHKGYPLSHINVEKKLMVNGLNKRYDIIVFNRDATIEVLVECKAPNIVIDQSTFDQVARYNLKANSNYLMLTNGLQHYYCQLDVKDEKYRFLKDIPDFSR
ncbi:MAG: type I restriction enzyme HsdR N-terminal domain-containing protein [Bacteroidota bacterium]